jgi:cellulose biosynthesis protein BcsQ
MPNLIKHARRLVLFNHKGGVGKTTLTVNLAFALVEKGHKVLLVDTDPQCSLTSFFLEEKYLDKLLDESETEKGNTLWSALRPVSEGLGPVCAIEPINIRKNLFIAAGDIRLSEFENSLSDCWRLCSERNRRGYHCTAALSQLVDILVEKTRADFVFFDSGPNIGPLNRIVLLDCTHFVIPAACDLFSMRALKTLGFALSQWVRVWGRNVEQAPEGIPVLEGRPQLAGFIPQGFRVYRGDMAAAPFSMLSKLRDRVTEFVWKPLQLAYGLSTTKPPTRLKIGQVKFFGDLATRGQNQGNPLWEVEGGSAAGKEEAKVAFFELADQLIATTTESNG